MSRRTPHLVLCTEADAEVGLGHAVRCAGLLEALTTSHMLTVIGGGPILASLFPHARHLNAPDWTRIDWHMLSLQSVDLVLADIPFYRPRDWSRVRHADAPLVVIDDHGGKIEADVIFNGTVLPEYHHYDACLSLEKLYVGPDYALIRPNFAATSWLGPSSDIVTIVIGSGAQAQDWALSLARLGSGAFNGSQVRLVTSRSFDALEKLQTLCAQGGIELHLSLSASKLAQMLSESGVALVTAGMLLYETVASGVPTVAYPQIPDLTREAAWFADRGACINLGLHNNHPELAAKAVNELLTNPQVARVMSHIQRSLIDGHGISRVAKILDNLL